MNSSGTTLRTEPFIPIESYTKSFTNGSNSSNSARFTVVLPEGRFKVACKDHRPFILTRVFDSHTYIPLNVRVGNDEPRTVYVRENDIKAIAGRHLQLPEKIEDAQATGKYVTETLAEVVLSEADAIRAKETTEYVLDNLQVLQIEGCRSNPIYTSGLEREWRDLYNCYLRDQFDEIPHAAENIQCIKTIDAFTQNISVAMAAGSGGSLIVKIEPKSSHNDFSQLMVTKAGPDSDFLEETQIKALPAYLFSIAEKIIEKLPVLPTASYVHSKVSEMSYKPILPPDMRHNQRLVTSEDSCSGQNAVDDFVFSYHYGFVSGYPLGEHLDDYNRHRDHPNLQTADFCVQESLRIGSLPIWVSCHVDGSGKGGAPAAFARQFSESFLTGIKSYLEKNTIFSCKEQAQALFHGIVYAQKQTTKQEKCRAAGTLLASLTMPDAQGTWQQVAIAVGDIDLVRVAPGGKIYIPTLETCEDEPLEVRYPGGQIGINRKGGCLPDLSNLRIIVSPRLQPKEWMISFSDGVIDNLYPYAFHRVPKEAIDEMKTENFPHLAGMERFVKLEKCTPEQREELLTFYKAYLCYKLATILKNSEQRGSMAAFIDTVLLTAQGRAVTKIENHPDSEMGVAINAVGHIVKSDDLSGTGIALTEKMEV